MKIYCVSHTTSEDNEAGLASGWKDVNLSKAGMRQAAEMGETFKGIKLDLICCSDLTRAVNTVQIAFGDSYPVIIDQRLRELNYGDFNGRPSATVEPMKIERITEPFPNGESYEQAIARTHNFFRELKSTSRAEAVLVVGHRVTRYGLETFTGKKTIVDCLNAPFIRQPYWEYTI